MWALNATKPIAIYFSMIISELGKQPIEGPLPAGNEVRNEPAFDRLEAEITKLSSPINSTSVDWALVTQVSVELLSTTGKDLMVACYLAGGLLETRSLSGLSEGLRIIADMLETYWETLYPPLKRIRGRRNALQWLIDRVQQRSGEISWTSLPPQDAALLAQMQTNLETIDAVLADKDTEAPSTRSLQTLVRALPVKEEVQATKLVQTSVMAKTAHNGPPPALAPESEEQADSALEEVFAKIVPIAEWLLDADLSNPLPYRLGRITAWTTINSLPLNNAGQTQISAPISQLVDALDRLKTSQVDEDLVHFSEAQLLAFPFWLDLNYICAEALGRMGSNFEAASREVSSKTALLVARLPDVQNLAFIGGMPFADGNTIAWLADLTSIKGNGDSRDAIKQGEESAIVAALGNARALAASDDVTGAVKCLQQQLDIASSPRDKLFLHIRLCELLLQQRPGAALDGFAHLLVDTIDRHQLAEWDAELTLDGLQIAYKVMTRNDDGKVAAVDLLKRIVSLNPIIAVKMVT